MENFSENQKRKRGRPISLQREICEKINEDFEVEGCPRTQLNDYYRLQFFGIVDKADPEDFKCIMGKTQQEMVSERGRFPRGYKSLALEVGRVIVGDDLTDDLTEEQKKRILDVVLDARRKGFSLVEIGRHFRSMRLGKQRGTVKGLRRAIIRTMNDYLRNYPGLTSDQIREALQQIEIIA